MKKSSLRLVRFVVLALFALIVTDDALSGPPLICHPIQIGNARSLPSGNGPFGAKVDYNRSRLVEETLGLLTPEMSILVRMETLRRATLYASGIYREKSGWSNQSEESRRIAFELLSQLMARALQATTDGKTNALALFDAGYLMACYDQANITKDSRGYELINKALLAGGENGEMQFACALVTVWPKRADHGRFLQKARAAARDNSLLALNLEEHFGNQKAQ